MPVIEKEYIVCPIGVRLPAPCKQERCAWWDFKNNRCAVLTVLLKAGEQE